MKKKLSLLFFVFAAFKLICADSLWNPDFKGYLTGENDLKPGDIVLVEINADSTLSFVSSSSDSKSLTFEFSGGEYANLLSFLPLIQSSDSGNLKGSQEISLQSHLATVVVDFDARGNARLEGSRDIRIDGKSESLSLTGTLSPALLGPGNIVSFQQLVNPRLTYTTLLAPREPTLSAEDILTVLAELSEQVTEPATEDTGQPEPEAPEPGVAPADETAAEEALPAIDAAPALEESTGTTSYTLSPEKKKELLLLYINDLIDFIFN